MLDWAADFDLSAFEDGGLPADFQSDFLLRLALLDEILIGRLDFGQMRGCGWRLGQARRWRPLWNAAGSRCCSANLFFLFLASQIVCFFRFFSFRFASAAAAAARLARVAGLGLGRPGRRIAVVGRLGQHLTQGQDLLAGNFADLESSVASRRALRRPSNGKPKKQKSVTKVSNSIQLKFNETKPEKRDTQTHKVGTGNQTDPNSPPPHWMSIAFTEMAKGSVSFA